MPRRFSIRNLLFGVIILLLVVVMIYSGLQILKPTVSLNEGQVTDDPSPSKTIERDGVKYFPRQDITVFMIAGIDKEGPVQDSGSYNNDGAADVVLLTVFDETAKTYDVICLNRDTMVEMPVLGLGGKKAGKTIGQLALAHTYGSGLEDSAENLKETVSALFSNVKIDYYLTMNMDAIGILNDAVGGVRVNITDDFSGIDPTLKKGEMVLDAKQARTFIQTRKGVGDQLNFSRMKRQSAYMEGFTKALAQKLDDDTFVLDVYSDITPYMVSDCSATTLSNTLNRYAEFSLDQIISPEGENKKGSEFMEFHLDQEKFDQLVVDTFFVKK